MLSLRPIQLSIRFRASSTSPPPSVTVGECVPFVEEADALGVLSRILGRICLLLLNKGCDICSSTFTKNRWRRDYNHCRELSSRRNKQPTVITKGSCGRGGFSRLVPTQSGGRRVVFVRYMMKIGGKYVGTVEQLCENPWLSIWGLNPPPPVYTNQVHTYISLL